MLRKFLKRTTYTVATIVGAAIFWGAAPTGGPQAIGGLSFDLVGTAEARYRDYDYDRLFRRYYRELAHYGHWVETRKYGLVWVPQVRRHWRPYSVGRWVWTHDYGWMWRSREPWGWATYQYGQWEWNRRLGWFWVPGYIWAPAWVSFSYDGDTIGWAPIPAWAVWGDRFDDYFFDQDPWWRDDRRYSDYWRDDNIWCFVARSDFGRRDVDRLIVPVTQNNIYIDNSTTIINITNVTIVNQTIVNNSLPLETVESFAGEPIQIANIETTTSVDDVVGDRGGRGERDDVVDVFRPDELMLPRDDRADGPGDRDRMRDIFSEIGTANVAIATDVLPPEDAPRPEIITDTLATPDAFPELPPAGEAPDLPPALLERLPDVPPELAPEPEVGPSEPGEPEPAPVPDLPPAIDRPDIDRPPVIDRPDIDQPVIDAPVYEEPQPEPRREPEPQPEPEPQVQPEPQPEPEPEPRREPEPEPQPEPQPEPRREPEPEPEPEPQVQPEPQPEAQPAPEPTPDPGERRRPDGDDDSSDEEPPDEGDEDQ